MPKDKAPAKGQKSIDSFFGKGKNAKKDESEDSESEIEVATISKAKKTITKGAAPDSSNLPPIHDIPTIFSDLVSRVPGIKDVAEHVNGRKIRVATMCSGTESPLLALELIQHSIQDHYQLNLDVEHVFSCEIEPFKQAYIERNFHPPILFRDVCELGNDEAHTAYGSLVPVPGDVDLLVAGTSCVDYSNLNNKKQTIEDNGESGRTFRGMLSWVKKHRPPIVILENVCGAAWDHMKGKFEGINYSAAFSRVDTKNFYIPHTRTRVYFVAVDKRKSSIPEKWKDLVINKLKRPASSTLDAFLLPSDDPRIHHARQKLVQESQRALDRRSGRTDWSRCESRHQRARLEEELGSKRPLTSWDEGGSCKLLDFAWSDWGVAQVERVWDLMDISLLRDAKKGVDPSYKTQVWNLSQNVDRTIGSGRVGICPCLTPTMIAYITNRGGPMVGLEALSMQGLPVDKLLLTRESEDQLADLAGNAMSTTVVGACILAALVVGKDLLKGGDDKATYESKRGVDDDENDAMDVDLPVETTTNLEDHIIGDDKLIYRPLDLSVTKNNSFSTILEQAAKSARLCSCEGRIEMTTRPLVRCVDCGASSCKKCGGRPEHNTVPIDVVAEPRLPPSDFDKILKSSLPMCLVLTSVTQELLDSLKDQSGANIPSKRWDEWCAAVLRVADSELRFVELKRQEIWSAVYRSPHATLELLLHPLQPEWRLYAHAEDSVPVNAEIRRVLESPIGRLACKGELLEGTWEFALPETIKTTISIKATGEMVPSWESRLGFTFEELREKKVASEVEVKVPEEDATNFDRDISGIYQLLDRCGTANGALHKRQAKEGEESVPPLFMLLDPHRTKESEDCFVFSISTRRYEFGETRPIIAKLDPEWRQSDKEGEQEVSCTLPVRWVPANATELKPSHREDAKFGIPDHQLQFSVSNEACESAVALLSCSVPLRGQASDWPRGTWKEVDKVHERSVFRSIAWLLERVRRVEDSFNTWQTVETPEGHDHAICERCAPRPPKVEYVQVNRKTLMVEDVIQAGEYERRLKKRPTPFVTQLKLQDDGTGVVRVGVNIASLLHRALSRLPTVGRTEEPTLLWRLDTNFSPAATLDLPKFAIMSNKKDKEHAQPPNFKTPLRKEQLRSLEWMLRQESKTAEPFVEEEVAEAILDPLGWRAEGCAQRPVRIRGGVLADQVGYGKTAITLGLIDCNWKDTKKEFEAMGDLEGKIAIKATLVIVPPHLTRQWDSEVRKFTGKNRFKTLVLSTLSNLNSATIEDFQSADVVIVASNLFKSTNYLDNLATLSGAGDFPTKEGRHFNDHLRKVTAALDGQTDRLKKKGAAAVKTEMQEAQRRAEMEAEQAAQAKAQSKRLKGKKYREQAEKLEAKTKQEAKSDSESEKAEEPTSGSPPAEPSKKRKKLVVEVVIPVKRTKSGASASASASSAATSATEEDDDDSRKKRKSRTVARKAIVVSDDEDDEEEAPRKRQKTSSTTSKRKASSKSDDDDFIVDDDEEEEEEDNEDDDDASVMSVDSDEDAPKPKKSKKPVKKPVKKLPRTPSSPPSSPPATSTDEDDMDVDDEAPKSKAKGKSGKTTKRKAKDDDDAPAKKKRADSDPWKLGTSAVKGDWTQMHSPPLEMFHFPRKVVDEYTYLDGKVHSLVTNLTAERLWVLSGTPPIHDFGALKTISAFLGIHLGIDDDAEGSPQEMRRRRNQQTDVEKFHSFREVHSLEWHAHRHELGQRFLDQFVRQNIAEIDEIPWTEKIVDVKLPAAERAIYLELEHYLRALEMTVKRTKKSESDREKRVAKSLGDSKSAEEALLKRCSHFDLETSNENAMKACDIIVKDREDQLKECKDDMLKSVKEGVKREEKLKDKVTTESMFHEWARVCRTEGVDDKDATEIVRDIIEKAKVPPTKSKFKKEEGNLSEKLKEAIWEHREKTHEIRRLTKELVGRVRSLRFFRAVRDLQSQSEKPAELLECPACGRENLEVEEMALLSSCGHTGCYECVKRCADKEECVYADSGACKSAARVLNIIKADTLGVDDKARDGHGRHFGRKLETVVDLIKNQIPKNERVLVFVQFPDLMQKVAEAFAHHKIDYLEIKGNATQRSKNLEKFQNDSDERVLLLNVMDESASGANLTSANHAVFLSPLLAPSQEIYNACETQAIGRLVRYGQTKHVNVYRFLTKDTIDEEIWEQRKAAVAA